MGKGLTHEQVVLLFLQLAVLLALAKLLGALMKRFGQPAVLGELLAGMILGPSLLGWAAPAVSAKLFPAAVAWGPTLETIAWFGLSLLMLLTGLETDVKLLRNLGRAAFSASAFGLVIPFLSGLALAHVMPDRFMPAGASRLLLALFVATALSISAMPVIAKILMDLGLMKRNLGVVTLTAAVVDDTIGWLLLAVIAGMAGGGPLQPWPVLRTVGWLVVFVAGVRYLLFPFARLLLKATQESPGGQTVTVCVITFLCAGATEAIGVHAVFGAFVAGAMLRQCLTLQPENMHRIETLTMAIFAPVFFAGVGLKVDLTKVEGVMWPLAVIGVAVGGKVIGCTAGGLLGRMKPVESLALGLTMSARGAMELVVAVVGISLGVISQELFSIIVLMALVTSFLAPLTVRPLIPLLPVTKEELDRERPDVPTFVPKGRFKALIPASGGSNAILAVHVAASLCGTEGDSATALYVQTGKPGLLGRLMFWRRRLPIDLEEYMKQLKAAGKGASTPLSIREVQVEGSVLNTILAEAKRGYPFVFLGASNQAHPIYQPLISAMISAEPCHEVIVRGRKDGSLPELPLKRILVPTDGSYYSDAAFQLAAAYAERTGAKVTVAYVAKSRELNPLLPSGSESGPEAMFEALRKQLATKIRPELLEVKVLEGASVAAALADEVAAGGHDLAVIGAENKSIVERVYVGQTVEAALEAISCAILVVIPKVAGR